MTADRTRTDIGRLRELLELARKRQQQGPARQDPKRDAAVGTTPGGASGSTAPRGGSSGTAPSGGSEDDEPPPRDEDAPPDDMAGAGRARPGPAGRAQPTPGERAGRDALALVIHEPAAMAHRIDEVLFADPLQRRAFKALASADNLHEAIEQSDDDVAELLIQLATYDPQTEADQAIVNLVRRVAREALSELEADCREAQLAGDDSSLSWLASTNSTVVKLKSELEVFSEVGAGDHPPKPVVEAADRLLGWLVSRQRGDA
jgi:hypothetical protein